MSILLVWYACMKLVTILTVQQAQQAFYTACMAQRALRSDTAADRCVNLAVHTSGKHKRIHTQPVLQVTHVRSTLQCKKARHTSGVWLSLSGLVLVLVYADQTLAKYAKQKIGFHRFGKAVGSHGMRAYPFKLVAPSHNFPCASAIDPKCCMELPGSDDQAGSCNRSLQDGQWLP